MIYGFGSCRITQHVQDGDKLEFSIVRIFPIANERQYVLVLYVRVLYARI